MQTLPRKITLNCKGRLVTLEKPAVMGILNTTPDSFYAASRHTAVDDVLHATEKMLADGADFIDVGAYSTRPGADDISAEDELKRAVPVVEAIAARFPEALISIDTFRAKVAEEAVHAGARIINDVSAGDDDADMMNVAAKLHVPYIMMHKKGNPKTMQHQAHYDDVVLDLLHYFTRKVADAKAAGITDLVIDPGFGFAKTLRHNYRLLDALGDFQLFGLPLLVGLSRKKMIRDIAQTDTAHALNATTAAHTIALLKGADILRVHDVKEAKECINIVNATHGII